jgi:hypothetical protein
MKKIRKNRHKQKKKSSIILFATAFFYLASRMYSLIYNVDWLLYVVIIFISFFVTIVMEKISIRNIFKDYKKFYSSYYFFPLIFLLYLSFNIINKQYSKSSPDEISICKIDNVSSNPKGSTHVWVTYKGKSYMLGTTLKAIMRMPSGLENPDDYYVRLKINNALFDTFYISYSIKHK